MGCNHTRVCVHGCELGLKARRLVQGEGTNSLCPPPHPCPLQILRNHVMVRVGGGWDTLGHYLDKHDPCRCTSLCESPGSPFPVTLGWEARSRGGR